MSKIVNRLDAHFAAIAAVGAVAALGGAQQSQAAIVWSGPVNLEITSSTNGLYLNVVTGATNQPGSTSGTNVPGWDINPYGSTNLSLFSATPTASSGYVARTGGGGPGNLIGGQTIDSTSTFITAITSASTTGNDPFVLSSSQNIVGFRFLNEADSQIHYGWFRVSLSTTLSSQPRAVVEYAYESVAGAGIVAGAVPAPTAGMGVLALGGLGLMGRRRK